MTKKPPQNGPGKPHASKQIGLKGLAAFKALSSMGKTDPLRFWQNAQTKYGDVIRFDLGIKTIWFFSAPEAIYEILVTNHKIMRKGMGYSGLKKLLGEGLITTDKDHWSDQRSRLNSAFTPKSIDAYAKAIQDACIESINELAELAKSNGKIDVSHAMTRLTMRVVSRAAFGVDLTKDHDEVVDAFEFSFAFLADITADPIRLPLIFPTKENRKFKKAKKIIDRFIDELIINSNLNDLADTSMSHKIFTVLKGNPPGLLRDEIISLYFAGFETTARSMTFIMDILAKNPNILKALRLEADKNSKSNKQDFSIADHPFAIEVVNEALRLYPPVAMMARQNNQDCSIAGHHIKANSMIIVCQFIAQRNPQYWSDEDQFAPDINIPLAERTTHRGAYAPFGAGPRLCIGKNFALLELAMATSMIAQRFDWRMENTDPMELDFHGTLRPKGKVMAHITLR